RSEAAQEAWRRRRAIMSTLSEADLHGEPIEGGALDSRSGVAELICAIDGRILHANAAAGDIGAIAPEKLVGRSVNEFPVVEERPSEQELLERLATGELSYSDADRTIVADDGTVRHLAVHRGVVRNAAAEPLALVVIANPIPEPEPCAVNFAVA